MYDSPLNEQLNQPPYSNGEFIELYNGSDSIISLEGWTISGDGTTEVFTFEEGSELKPHKYCLVAFKHPYSDFYPIPFYPAKYSILPPQPNTGIDVPHIPSYSIYTQHSLILANEGETLTLRNNEGQIMDIVHYDGNSHLSNPLRLHAENNDNIYGIECVCLNRVWAEFDESGKVVDETSEWQTNYVLLASNSLKNSNFYENEIISASDLSSDDNYILSVAPLDNTTRLTATDGKVSLSNGIRTKTEITYFDGLGRETEQVAVNASPVGKDIVTLTEYTGLDYATRLYLPVYTTSGGQRITATDYIQAAQNLYNDSRPYSETQYETVLSRLTSKTKAGSNYSSHPALNIYETNTSEDNVIHFEIIESGSDVNVTNKGNFSANALYKQTTTDEDGVTVIAFSDKTGHTILERHAQADTYYIYDALGRLRCVLPPLASQAMTSQGNYNLTANDILKSAAYYYQYDAAGNCIYKRLPACEPWLAVYDYAGQIVLSQSGNERAKGVWTLYGYDNKGRQVYIAAIPLSQTHTELIELYKDKWQVEHYDRSRQPNFIGSTGYASTILGNHKVQPLVVWFYDTYDFLDRLPTGSKPQLKYQPQQGYDAAYSNSNNMLTGKRVYNLTDDGFVTYSYYYDDKERIVQQHSTMHQGGYCHTWNRYNFDGTITKQTNQQIVNDSTTTEYYTYSYDHLGRLLNTYYKLNNGSEYLLSSLVYDSIGRLSMNIRHSGTDTIRYTYDMRNSLKRINNRWYDETLYYADGNSILSNPRYNGNISAANIQTTSTLTESGKETHFYRYDYDNQNRLILCSVINGIINFLPVESFIYDNQGNILSLKRYTIPVKTNILPPSSIFPIEPEVFDIETEQTNHSRLIDDLDYTYYPNSNQAQYIEDNGTNLDMYNVAEYINHNDTATNLIYDSNGNMIQDLDRGIRRIAYNRLNLPDTICFTNGNLLINKYDAEGIKYQTNYYVRRSNAISVPTKSNEQTNCSNDIITTTNYTPHQERKTYSWTNSEVTRIYNPEGYYERRKDKTIITSSLNYYYRDRLGSNVAVWDATHDTLIQQTLYYPSGLPMPRSNNASAQTRKYNGKELITAEGMNEYDCEARWYNPIVMRTGTIDPHAENYYHLSPYSWCGNNPINAIDPNGMDYTVEVDTDSATITVSATYYATEQDTESAQQAVDFWNGFNDVFAYIEDGVEYSVKFNLIVVQGKSDFEDSQTFGRWLYSNGYSSQGANTYMLTKKLEDNVNGRTISSWKVLVKYGREMTETGAHEIGHTLSLLHSECGIMTAESTNIFRGRYVTDENIYDIITFPFKYNQTKLRFKKSYNKLPIRGIGGKIIRK